MDVNLLAGALAGLVLSALLVTSRAECADFLLAPEITMPFAGWPYDRILTDIVVPPAVRTLSFQRSYQDEPTSLSVLRGCFKNAANMIQTFFYVEQAETAMPGGQ